MLLVLALFQGKVLHFSVQILFRGGLVDRAILTFLRLMPCIGLLATLLLAVVLRLGTFTESATAAADLLVEVTATI